LPQPHDRVEAQPHDRVGPRDDREEEYSDETQTAHLFRINEQAGAVVNHHMCNNMVFDLSYQTDLTGDMFSQPSLLMHQNVSIDGAVTEEDYAYYQVCVARVEGVLDIRIELTSVQGDADLYISTENPKPDKAHSTWISADPGDDKIDLRTDLDDYVTALAKSSYSQGQTLFLGVFGRTPASFSIRVLVSDHATPAPGQRLRGNGKSLAEVMRERRKAKRREKKRREKYVRPPNLIPRGTNQHPKKDVLQEVLQEQQKREVR